MPKSNARSERYLAQADEMIAVAAKTPIPILYAKPFEVVAVAHGCWNAARRKALPDVLD